MAGLEVLGAAASAAQLADYGRGIVIFLTKLYKRVKNAPKQYREYETQLHLLIRNAEHIANSPALQAPDVRLDLDSIEVEVRALQAILCHPVTGSSTSSNPRSLWTLVKGVEQSEIEEYLDRLHRKNSTLSFYILTVSAGKVHRNVEKLVETMPVLERSPAASVKEKYTTPQANRRPWETTSLDNDNQLVAYERPHPSPPDDIEDSDITYDMSEMPYTQRNEYKEIVIRGPAEVVNGDKTTCSSCSGGCTCKPLGIGSRYHKIEIKSESAAVINGTIGTPNGAEYVHIKNSKDEKDDEGYKEDTSVKIFNGSFRSEMDSETWFRKQRAARREQRAERDRAKKDRESGRG